MSDNSVIAQLARIDTTPSPERYHEKAVQAANFVREIVLKRAVQISGRRYVPTEAYQAIANAMGCVASARDVRKGDAGWTALGEVKRLSDGKVLAEGEGFVGFDEPKWAKGPEYAARSMAQTRAVGRACRAAFAFVVPMIDLNLQPTPAEELEGINPGTIDPPPPAPRGNAAIKNALRPTPPPARQSPPHTADADFRPEPSGGATHDRNFVMSWANKKNEPLHALSEKSLKWFQSALIQNIADPSKARFKEKAERELELIETELAFRGLS